VRTGFEWRPGNRGTFNDVKVGRHSGVLPGDQAIPPPEAAAQGTSAARNRSAGISQASPGLRVACHACRTTHIGVHIAEAQSLKDKRQVLRSLKGSLAGAILNVAVAELDFEEYLAAIGGRCGGRCRMKSIMWKRPCKKF